MLSGRFRRQFVPRIRMPDDPHPGVVSQNAAQPGRSRIRAVRHDDHSGMDAIAHSDPAAMMKAYPGGSAGGIDKGVENGPVGYGIASVEHRLRFAVGRGNGAGVEMITTDDNRGLYRPGTH